MFCFKITFFSNLKQTQAELFNKIIKTGSIEIVQTVLNCSKFRYKISVEIVQNSFEINQNSFEIF